MHPAGGPYGILSACLVLPNGAVGLHINHCIAQQYRRRSDSHLAVQRVSGAESPYLNLAGYGRGLPLAKLYCEYFGGALHLLPTNGIGTDCYIYILRNLDYISDFE